MKHSEETTDRTSTGIESRTETDTTATETRSDRARQLYEEFVVAPAKVMWSDWRARFGMTVVMLYLSMGLVAWVSASNWWLLAEISIVEPPGLNSGPRYVPPFQTWEFPLGTDSLGQGIFAQIIHATPAMLQMIGAGAIFGTSVGTGVGILAGYKGGRVDQVLMWCTDVMLTIPGLPLVIVLAAVLSPRNPFVVGIILTINDWSGLARMVRSQVLTIRRESYVEASRTMGIGTGTILTKDVLPNLMPYVSVNFVGMARSVIFASVGLYFLGILPFSTLNWGVMMNLAYNTGGALYTWDTAHWLFFPMLAIVLLSLALILLAQGADRVFNPRIRARHAGTGEGDEDEAGTGTVDSPGTRPEVIRQ